MMNLVSRLRIQSLIHVCCLRPSRTRVDKMIGGQPVAAFDASTCDPNKYFQTQQLILNINLCGESQRTFNSHDVKALEKKRPRLMNCLGIGDWAGGNYARKSGQTVFECMLVPITDPC